MAWIRIESSVARNRKFVKAGPAPSWLWLCGLGYCQEGLTDGFIPEESIDFLGVRNARQLAKHLVSAGLWAVVDGGWLVHDYLDHNKPAAEVNRIREERRLAGAHGGEASGYTRRNKVLRRVEANAKQPANPSTASTSTAVRTATATVAEPAAPMDTWFVRLKGLYPPRRITSGHRTMTAFVDALLSGAAGPEATFGRMLSNLELQKRGHEWRVKGMVPALEKWLREGLWEQEHQAAPPETLVNERTARTLTSGAAFVAGGGK